MSALPEPIDVQSIRDHAERIYKRMKQTPEGSKRFSLACQHADKIDQAKFAEGWNACLAAICPTQQEASQ